ncbi:hypothetical protein [Ureibacillus thermophilus]|nr:hypothetical protein [Ureibacillus thermophilus]
MGVNARKGAVSARNGEVNARKGAVSAPNGEVNARTKWSNKRTK